jgi:Bacterial PH domain/Short C-terminal domain
MALPRKLLTEGESVVVELRPTWLVLGWPLVATVSAAALAVAAVVAFPKAPVGVGYVLLALLLIAAAWLAVRALRWHTTNIVLTTSRVLERRGVFGRSGVEIRLDRVNELCYRQTLIERLVHTGSLEVEVGGETGVVVFTHLPHPAAVQSLVTEQIENLRRARSPWQTPVGAPGAMGMPQPAAAPPGPGFYAQPAPVMPPPPQVHGGLTVADRLMQLDQLRQRGILTDSEFQAKKLELLQQL